jgi:hypothetical protein
VSTKEKPLTPEERDRLAAGKAAFEVWSQRFDGRMVEDWDKDLADSERQDWADIAEAASDEIAAHVNLERDARIQHLEELLTEVLWAVGEWSGFGEDKARIAEWRKRAAIEVQS